MKRSLRSRLVMAFSLTFVFSQGQGSAELIEDVKPSVVKVIASVNGKTKVGTGMVVRTEPKAVYIVTASHVIEGDPSPNIEFFSRKNHYVPAKVVGLEGGDDRGLAALVVSGEWPRGTKPMPLNQQIEVKAGDAVTLVGFPRLAGVPWAVTKGETVGRKGRDLVFSSPVDEGSSGGPLLKENQVIGIVTEVGSPFAYAVPSLIAQYALESWGVRFGVHLRSEPATVLAQHVEHMVKAYRFHHPSDFSDKKYSGFVMGAFEHVFDTQTIQGTNVVVDQTTGLMWQQDGSEKPMNFTAAEAYLKSLNEKKHAGFSDWRLPTIEEMASLIEPIGVNNFLFIDSRFSSAQASCWTIDRKQQKPIQFLWVVDFQQGGIYSDTWRSIYFVRAVRSVDSPLSSR